VRPPARLCSDSTLAGSDRKQPSPPAHVRAIAAELKRRNPALETAGVDLAEHLTAVAREVARFRRNELGK
jgi:hypothetical protein